MRMVLPPGWGGQGQTRYGPKPHQAAHTGLLPATWRPSLACPAATALGATLADRLRINATWALRGMWRAGQDGGGALRFVGSLQSRLK